MLITNDQHEVQAFPFMRVPGIKTWSAVGLNLWTPYFFVSYEGKDEHVWQSQAVVLSRESDLIDFCLQGLNSDTQRIFQIVRLTPPSPDAIDDWRWHAISEISLCKSLLGGPLVPVLTTDDGYCHIRPGSGEMHQLQHVAKIFSSKVSALKN